MPFAGSWASTTHPSISSGRNPEVRNGKNNPRRSRVVYTCGDECPVGNTEECGPDPPAAPCWMGRAELGVVMVVAG